MGIQKGTEKGEKEMIKYGSIILLAGILVIPGIALGQTPIPTPSPTITPVPASTPTPEPTPEDDASAEVIFAYIQRQPGYEKWVEENYDPVETRSGECISPKDIIFQSPGFAVIGTLGYENIYYGDGSGDIRGIACQGFIDIEATEVSFNIMDLFVSTAYADPGKWKKVKTIKKKTYPQVKPKKPKKVKWKKTFGLKEKKDALGVSE